MKIFYYFEYVIIIILRQRFEFVQLVPKKTNLTNHVQPKRI